MVGYVSLMLSGDRKIDQLWKLEAHCNVRGDLFDRCKVFSRIRLWTIKHGRAKTFWRLIFVVTDVMQNQRRCTIDGRSPWDPDFRGTQTQYAPAITECWLNGEANVAPTEIAVVIAAGIPQWIFH